MPNPDQDQKLAQLRARLEPDSDTGVTGDMVAANIAISLKRIADALEGNAPPMIKRR